MQIRYLNEINSFHDWLITNQISSSARLLWFSLMNYCNKTGWKSEFNLAISALELDTGLSKQSIIRARNVLQQRGRIEVTVRRGNQSTIYKIIPFSFQNGTQCDTQTGRKPDANRTQCDTHGDTIHRLDETKSKNRKEYTPLPPNGGNVGNESDGHVKPKKSRKIFRAPDVEEVRAYCQERNNSVDADAFVDFYESKGWCVGRNTMKDWHAAVRTWERNSRGRYSGGRSTNSKQEAIDVVNRLAEKYAAEEGR